MIDMYQVSKIYSNNVTALDEVNLHIDKGEFVFMVGPSGAGKTTLMRLIFRDETPTTGSILIDGRNIERLSLGAIPYLRRSIGVVFQDFKLLPEKTAYENVAFALRVVEASSEEVEAKTNKILETLGLEQRKHFLPAELSAGEQQRVCIARALVNDPAILLTDEPTGNLDSMHGEEVMTLLNELNKAGTTIIMVTHSQRDASYSRRIVHLFDGQIINENINSMS